MLTLTVALDCAAVVALAMSAVAGERATPVHRECGASAAPTCAMPQRGRRRLLFPAQ
jgi:hypothetical protein